MAVDPRIQAALDAPLRHSAGTLGKKVAAGTRGYAATPGTGPAGETCGSCKHLIRREFAKVYRKCRLTETRGASTDIKVRSPACLAWEAR